MHVHRALFHIDIAAPDLIQQLSAAVCAFLVRHKKLQQLVLGGAHVQGFGIGEHAVTDRIQHQPRHLHRVALLRVGAAPQHRLDPRQQLARGARFGDVVVGADIQALDTVVLVVLGGQHDHGNIAADVVATQAPQQLQAAGVGHHPVQKNQIRAFVQYLAIGLLGLGRLHALKTGHFQADAHHFPDGALIIDDKNTAICHSFSGHGCRLSAMH